jgi:hypothetical protein
MEANMSMASEFNDVLNLRQIYQSNLGSNYRVINIYDADRNLISTDVYHYRNLMPTTGRSKWRIPAVGATPFLSVRLDGTITVAGWRPHRMSRYVWNKLIEMIEKRAYEVDRVCEQVTYKRRTNVTNSIGESFTEFLSSKYELMEVGNGN